MLLLLLFFFSVVSVSVFDYAFLFWSRSFVLYPV